jgi:hypothetical protein
MRAERLRRVVQALCAAFPRRQQPAWAHCAFYLAHITVCEELAACLFPPRVRWRIGLAGSFMSMVSIRRLLPAHLETAWTLHTLERIAHAQHRCEQAERLYRQTLQIKKRTPGREHAETATTLLAPG